jgi:hypothetical protein
MQNIPNQSKEQKKKKEKKGNKYKSADLLTPTNVESATNKPEILQFKTKHVGIAKDPKDIANEEEISKLREAASKRRKSIGVGALKAVGPALSSELNTQYLKRTTGEQKVTTFAAKASRLWEKTAGSLFQSKSTYESRINRDFNLFGMYIQRFEDILADKVFVFHQLTNIYPTNDNIDKVANNDKIFKEELYNKSEETKAKLGNSLETQEIKDQLNSTNIFVLTHEIIKLKAIIDNFKNAGQVNNPKAKFITNNQTGAIEPDKSKDTLSYYEYYKHNTSIYTPDKLSSQIISQDFYKLLNECERKMLELINDAKIQNVVTLTPAIIASNSVLNSSNNHQNESNNFLLPDELPPIPSQQIPRNEDMEIEPITQETLTSPTEQNNPSIAFQVENISQSTEFKTPSVENIIASDEKSFIKKYFGENDVIIDTIAYQKINNDTYLYNAIGGILTENQDKDVRFPINNGSLTKFEQNQFLKIQNHLKINKHNTVKIVGGIITFLDANGQNVDPDININAETKPVNKERNKKETYDFTNYENIEDVIENVFTKYPNSIITGTLSDNIITCKKAEGTKFNVEVKNAVVIKELFKYNKMNVYIEKREINNVDKFHVPSFDKTKYEKLKVELPKLEKQIKLIENTEKLRPLIESNHDLKNLIKRNFLNTEKRGILAVKLINEESVTFQFTDEFTQVKDEIVIDDNFNIKTIETLNLMKNENLCLDFFENTIIITDPDGFGANADLKKMIPKYADEPTNNPIKLN